MKPAVFDPEVGEAEHGIPAGTPLERLPEDWECPLRSVSKENFKKEEQAYETTHMEFSTLVRSAHVNHNDKLFGGYMLLWVDEYAYIAGITEYPDAHFVARAMDTVSFPKGVGLGAVLTFEVDSVKV